MAMLLGAEPVPKEINGVGAAHDGGVVVIIRDAELGQYMFGGFGGAGCGTGFFVNFCGGLVVMSKGGFVPP